MKHPFYKMLNRELSRSSSSENFVLQKAEEIMKKGYRPEEIYKVLVNLQAGLIDDNEGEIMQEAVEEFSNYVDLDKID